ncbi:MAG: hypothetical protein CSA68_02645 [Rhodobacterales bacterium]|nr:MAG: hypothetical protein CSA68_02645 [Rhodobacterales bacterium]
MNMKRVYGYSHTSAEAVQQMNFLHGTFKPNEDLLPLISPRWQELNQQNDEHTPSDVYVVEICSAKQATIDGQSVQLNYLKRRYRDFFSDPERDRMCFRLAAGADEEALGTWLDEVWSANETQHKDSSILRQLRVRQANLDMVRDDMVRLQDGLGEVLFVTHVNARDGNGNVLTGRDALIKTVTQAAQQIGARLYNPTALMEKVGQTQAIEDHSAGLAHFTESFSQRVLEDWYEFAIHDIIENYIINTPDDAIERIVVPHAKAFLATPDPEHVAYITTLLDALESYFPENPQLKLLRMKIARSEGNEDALKRAFFRLAIAGNLADLKALDSEIRTLPQLDAWIEELRAAEALSDDTVGWLLSR